MIKMETSLFFQVCFKMQYKCVIIKANIMNSHNVDEDIRGRR